jgi:putative hydroxymethylpyrimidine transport system ATP-binding protein
MIAHDSSAPGGPAVEVRNLTLGYDGGLLFDDLRFDLPGGRITALLGASGVGKTSLLRVLAGFVAAPGCSIADSAGTSLHGRVATMGQGEPLLPWLSAVANVCIGDSLRGTRPDRARALALLDRVGLAGRGASLPATLSGGMRQRVALARTLYEDKPVVLMDEPFSALDGLNRARMQTLTADLLRGRTVLLITHDPLEACRLADSILVLSGFPATLSAPLILEGPTPRGVDDPQMLAAQGALLRALVDGRE